MKTREWVTLSWDKTIIQASQGARVEWAEWARKRDNQLARAHGDAHTLALIVALCWREVYWNLQLVDPLRTCPKSPGHFQEKETGIHLIGALIKPFIHFFTLCSPSLWFCLLKPCLFLVSGTLFSILLRVFFLPSSSGLYFVDLMSMVLVPFFIPRTSCTL